MEEHDYQPDRTGILDTGPDAPVAVSGPPLVVSHAEMNSALAAATAVAFAPAITWLTRYQDRWWIVYEHGWLCITDQITAADIDQRAALINAGPGTGPGPD